MATGRMSLNFIHWLYKRKILICTVYILKEYGILNVAIPKCCCSMQDDTCFEACSYVNVSTEAYVLQQKHLENYRVTFSLCNSFYLLDFFRLFYTICLFLIGWQNYLMIILLGSFSLSYNKFGILSFICDI